MSTDFEEVLYHSKFEKQFGIIDDILFYYNYNRN